MDDYRKYFPDPLCVSPIFGGNWKQRQLLEIFRYYYAEDKSPIVAPKGFLTDYASIPWFVRWLISPWGKHGPGAVIHDYLYSVCAGKLWADWIFLKAMKHMGVGFAKRWAMFLAVVFFGWFAYWKHKRRNKN